MYTWGANYNGQLGNGTNEDSNEPICITDSKESKLYNKKIKFVNTLDLSDYKFSSYIMENGELYNWYVYVVPVPN